MVDLPLIDPLADDLGKGMMEIDTEASEIVEIPRLNFQDKVAVCSCCSCRNFPVLFTKKN